MSAKNFIIRSIIAWMFRRWPYQCIDIVIPKGKHVHSNPTKKPVTGSTLVGQSHTARMAGGAE